MRLYHTLYFDKKRRKKTLAKNAKTKKKLSLRHGGKRNKKLEMRKEEFKREEFLAKPPRTPRAARRRRSSH